MKEAVHLRRELGRGQGGRNVMSPPLANVTSTLASCWISNHSRVSPVEGTLA